MPKKGRAKRAAAAAAATDTAPDGKKARPLGFVITFTVLAPDDVSPVPLKLDARYEPIRAARKAKDKATSVKHYRKENEKEFAKLFEAAVASAFAQAGEPVLLSRAITEMTNMTDCEPKFEHGRLKEQWCWDGFVRGRWQISRHSGSGVLPFPKESSRRSAGKSRKWKFSPRPAARCPPADQSK